MNRFYYGMVGNGETAALIGPDLAVDWLCLPRFDGTPFFASALDPRRGGRLALGWDGWPGGAGLGIGGAPVTGTGGEPAMEQEYIPSTNVLRTVVTAGGLRVEAKDSMPWGRPVLLRRLTVTKTEAPVGKEGERPVHLVVDAMPTASEQWGFDVRHDAVPVAAGLSLPTMTLVEKEGALVVGWIRGAGAGVVSRAENPLPDPVHRGEGGRLIFAVPDLAKGESADVVLLLAYGQDEGEAAGRWGQAAQELSRRPPGDPEGLRGEIDFWIDWLRPARLPKGTAPDLLDAYVRGLLIMKLLTHEGSGAILAAPTASFPAVPGGHDNWDYRYCWIRDGYYTARTFDEAGLHDEARAFYKFALGLQEPDGHWSQPLYTLDGGGPAELLVGDLAGPGGEGPIRFGNAAYDQLQIDNEPSVLHGLWMHGERTGDWQFIASRWDAVRRAATAMTKLWSERENGIWEIRERRDHWIYGKALCAAGFQAAAAMAETLGHRDDAATWRAEGKKIREQLIEQGFTEERGAYLQTYDPDSPLDISALALVLWDVLPADDERIRRTVEKMEQPLRRPEPIASSVGAGQVHRPVDGPGGQPTTDDPFWGMHDAKGGLEMDGAFARYDYGAEPFYLPTLWMARYYLRAGNRARAEALVRLCLRSATNLGLMAEHFSPATGAQWGNFPQAFSHEEMALTILELASSS